MDLQRLLSIIGQRSKGVDMKRKIKEKDLILVRAYDGLYGLRFKAMRVTKIDEYIHGEWYDVKTDDTIEFRHKGSIKEEPYVAIDENIESKEEVINHVLLQNTTYVKGVKE